MFEQSGLLESWSKVWTAMRKCVWALPCCKSVLLHIRFTRTVGVPRLFVLTCGLDYSLTGAACMIVCSSSQGMFRNFDAVKWNGARENQKTFLCGSKNVMRWVIAVMRKQFVWSEWAVRSRSGQCVSVVWDLLTQNKLQAFTLAD